MELEVAVKLVEKGIERKSNPQQWADLGAGTGLFSRALASLLPASSTIVAIDRDAHALQQIKNLPPSIKLITKTQDFTLDSFGEAALDGLLMANALHFVKDQKVFLQNIKTRLKPGGQLILIEYDMDTANTWVPFPISFATLQNQMWDYGISSATKLAETPSSYGRAMIYSAAVRFH